MVRFAVTHPTAGLPGCCRSSHWCAPQLCCLPGRSPACHRPGYWRGGARWSSTSETGSSEIWCCDWPGPAAAGSWWHWKRPGRCGSPRRRRTSSAIWRDGGTTTKRKRMASYQLLLRDKRNTSSASEALLHVITYLFAGTFVTLNLASACQTSDVPDERWELKDWYCLYTLEKNLFVRLTLRLKPRLNSNPGCVCQLEENKHYCRTEN